MVAVIFKAKVRDQRSEIRSQSGSNYTLTWTRIGVSKQSSQHGGTDCLLLLTASCLLPTAYCLLFSEPSLTVGLLTCPAPSITHPLTQVVLTVYSCLLPPAYCLLFSEPSLTVGLLTRSADGNVRTPTRLRFQPQTS